MRRAGARAADGDDKTALAVTAAARAAEGRPHALGMLRSQCLDMVRQDRLSAAAAASIALESVMVV